MHGESGPRFDRYVGIDYSGAKTPATSLPGLRDFAVTNRRPGERLVLLRERAPR